jgi:hypothetical protein
MEKESRKWRQFTVQKQFAQVVHGRRRKQGAQEEETQEEVEFQEAPQVQLKLNVMV